MDEICTPERLVFEAKHPSGVHFSLWETENPHLFTLSLLSSNGETEEVFDTEEDARQFARKLWRDMSVPNCWKCGGKGIFYGRGIVENGVFKGYSGPCFACNGKGKQTNGDVLRCATYWKYRGL